MQLSSAKMTMKCSSVVTKGGSDPDSDASWSHSIEQSSSLTHGTSDDQADIAWAKTYTIAALGTKDIDLIGALTDAFGVTVNALEIVGLFIRETGGLAEIEIGEAAANEWTQLWGLAGDSMKIKAGGFFAIGAPKTGYGAVGGATDTLRITNNDAGDVAVVEVKVIGRTA